MESRPAILHCRLMAGLLRYHHRRCCHALGLNLAEKLLAVEVAGHAYATRRKLIEEGFGIERFGVAHASGRQLIEERFGIKVTGNAYTPGLEFVKKGLAVE